MNLFPTKIVGWTEPAAYSYGNLKAKRLWWILPFVLFSVGLTQWNRGMRIEAAVTVLALVVVVGLFAPLIFFLNERWPKLFTLTGNYAALYEDRIACMSGKSEAYVMLENMSECTCTLTKSDTGEYYRFDFRPKTFGLFGNLASTATNSRAIVDQVLDHLQAKGVTICREGFSS